MGAKEVIIIMMIYGIAAFMSSCYMLIKIIKKISSRIIKTLKIGTFNIIKREA